MPAEKLSDPPVRRDTEFNWERSSRMAEEGLLECDLCPSDEVVSITRRGENGIFHLCSDCSKEYPFLLWRQDPPPPPTITEREILWARDQFESQQSGEVKEKPTPYS